MNTTDATTRTTWHGWYRPRGGAWRKITSALTAAECWSLQLGAIAGLPSGDSLVLPSGREPMPPRLGRVT